MARPSNSRLARAAIIIVALGALLWIVSFVGISLSGKQTKDKTPEPIGAPANPG
ncbi:hypothetical protein [Sphingomonas sp. IC4-52]|uniref:hypothetical protein n=1 Tax=Sphingomonas sp. IC4-52 TaxID=2887202 RepID=UPI001D10C1F1|nr:hypothetical protein [Sphingomonas sp. IC4-52]MCC2981060.1 hypothetical protein [Sphingomonas sp. IC4-52]